MRRPLALLAVLTAGALAVPATAAGPNGLYTGRAKSLDSTFSYGKVTIRVRDGRVRNLKIETVTSTGPCGGSYTVVFAPGDPETQVLAGSARVKNGRFFVRFRPVRSVEDQETTINATVSGGVFKGTFKSGPLCGNAGRFSARR